MVGSPRAYNVQLLYTRRTRRIDLIVLASLSLSKVQAVHPSEFGRASSIEVRPDHARQTVFVTMPPRRSIDEELVVPLLWTRLPAVRPRFLDRYLRGSLLNANLAREAVSTTSSSAPSSGPPL